jgi:hypothetical protein
MYIIDKLLETRDRAGIREYKVLWEGGEITWEPFDYIPDAMRKAYYKRVLGY